MSGMELKSETGTDKLILSDHNGMVVMHFDHPVEWVALDPETARVVAEQMARKAYACTFGDTPTTTDKSQMTEQLRARMKNRVKTMLTGWFDNPPAPEVQARNIVDAIFKEVA